MRAVELSIFIALLGLGLSVAGAVTGYTNVQGDMGILDSYTSSNAQQSAEIAEQNTGWMGKTLYMAGAIINSVSILYHIIVDTALIGSTINKLLAPYELPSVLVIGLNALGSISISLTMIQFITGRGFRGME